MSRGMSTLVDGTRAAVERFSLGVLLEERGDLASAELAYRQADALGHAGAALNLGVLHEARGDLPAAQTCYRRAHKRGDENGAFNLGAVLEERGDLAGAKRAYRLADAAGHASAAGRLAAVLATTGDADGAQVARRRAQERSDVVGSPVPPSSHVRQRRARWAAQRPAVLVLATSAAVVVGARCRALHPKSRRDAFAAHRVAGRQRTAAGTAGDGLGDELDVVGHAQHLTPHRGDIQGKAGARPDPRIASGARTRAGQGARARTDACLQSGHHPLESGHHRPAPARAPARLDGHLGTDGHAHLACHADASSPPPHPDSRDATSGHPDATLTPPPTHSNGGGSGNGVASGGGPPSSGTRAAASPPAEVRRPAAARAAGAAAAAQRAARAAGPRQRHRRHERPELARRRLFQRSCREQLVQRRAEALGVVRPRVGRASNRARNGLDAERRQLGGIE